MKRSFLSVLVAASLFVAGCGSKAETDTPPANQPEKPTVSNESKTTPTASESNELKVGMDLVEVKELKGAPDDTKHEHGPAGQEYDIWIWKDVQATIENGKVIKVEKR